MLHIHVPHTLPYWLRMFGRTVRRCVWVSCVCASVFLLFFLKTIYFWKTVVVVPFWAPRMYTFAVKKKRFPPICWMPAALVNGCQFLFIFFFFHCGISRCFHLPFGWASLLWCTSRRFSGLLHKAFRMFFFFFVNSFETVTTNRAFYTVQFSFLCSKSSFFLKSRQVYCVCCGSPRHCLRETAPFDSKAVMKRHRRHVLGLARD